MSSDHRSKEKAAGYHVPVRQSPWGIFWEVKVEGVGSGTQQTDFK